MPRASTPRFRVVKSFDFHPRKGVIQAFIAGQERTGLTRSQIERGESLGALISIPSDKEQNDG